MDKKELKSLWLKRDKQGTRKIKIDALRLKRYARLDKMKKKLRKRHNTPDKWDKRGKEYELLQRDDG